MEFNENTLASLLDCMIQSRENYIKIKALEVALLDMDIEVYDAYMHNQREDMAHDRELEILKDKRANLG